MKHTIIGHQQGSAAWKEHRAKCFNASEAASMLGAGKYASRTELLDEKVTGLAREVSPQQQALYDRGHAAEAAARTLVEQKLGQDLYAITAAAEVDGMVLSASYDGLTIAKDVAFEHKLWNEALAAQVTAGELEPHYYWQLEQQLMIVGAERVIFVVSDGTPERFVSMEYTPVEGRREQLLAGWAQFHKDLDAHLPVVHKETPKGVKGAELPALVIKVSGSVTASNLGEWRVLARQRIEAINVDLKTDDDFGQAVEDVKWCKDSADRIKLLKAQVLEQMADVNEIATTLDAMVAFLDRKRLDVDALVERRKLEIRNDVVARGQRELADHLAGLLKRVPHAITAAEVQADFQKAVKGKRTVKSLNDAVNDEVTRCKLGASALADRMQENLAHLAKEAGELMTLFPDQGTICRKLPEDFKLVVESRLAKHREQVAAAARRLAEEQAAAEQRQQDEQRRLATNTALGCATITQGAAFPVDRPGASGAQIHTRPPIHGDQVYHQGGPGGMGYESGARVSAPASAPAGPPTLKLGDVNRHMAPLSITADGLHQLGFEPAARERSALLFHESDLPRILAAAIQQLTNARDHLTEVA